MLDIVFDTVGALWLLLVTLDLSASADDARNGDSVSPSGFLLRLFRLRRRWSSVLLLIMRLPVLDQVRRLCHDDLGMYSVVKRWIVKME